MFMSQSLQSFIAEEKEKIVLFERYWLENNAVNPDAFPMEFPDGNMGLWFEQYTEFNSDDYLSGKIPD
jgi:hypothetical protein